MQGPVSIEQVDSLIQQGALSVTPMIYEDFLPVSAAGIFQSNLGESSHDNYGSSASQQQFEQALGATVIDEIELYTQRQQASLEQALAQLAN